jgi:hypothetical protein
MCALILKHKLQPIWDLEDIKLKQFSNLGGGFYLTPFLSTKYASPLIKLHLSADMTLVAFTGGEVLFYVLDNTLVVEIFPPQIIQR